ncbi:MAG: iron-sulfur cluster-binding domain-containing protein, partial [Pseudomonadota bacterium]
VTVKRVEGGVVSNYLNDCLKPGEEVEVADISGHFNWVDAYHDKPLFLSGGSGVTPVMSMLQYLTDVTAPRDIVFVHFAKTPKDIIFRDQLEFLAKRFDNVTVHLVISQPDEQDWDGETGRISAELLQKLVPDHAERGVFLCGPEGFMKAARDAAKDISFAAFNEESFGEKITLTKTKGTGGEVFFSQSGLNGQCAPHETLLEAALNTGVWIDSACQQGVCGNCKVLVTQGEVEMQDMGGLMPGEAEAGYVLACCSRPKGAVAIEA